MAVKVVIENSVLRGSHQEQFLQRVATVYVDQAEYRVSAPAKATGNALTWVNHFVVRQPSDMGENNVEDGRYASVVQQVVNELEKHDIESDIWRDVNSSGHYCPAQICLRGHVHSVDGTPYKADERCPQCGEPCIDRCPSCKAPIRGEVVYTQKYTLAFYCYKCGRPYPWMEDRLQTAKELLDHDDKLSLEDREELWSLLQYVMSDPKSGMVPAKNKLIEFRLAKALPATKDLVLDFLAKVTAEIIKS